MVQLRCRALETRHSKFDLVFLLRDERARSIHHRSHTQMPRILSRAWPWHQASAYGQFQELCVRCHKASRLGRAACSLHHQPSKHAALQFNVRLSDSGEPSLVSSYRWYSISIGSASCEGGFICTQGVFDMSRVPVSGSGVASGVRFK